jgi:Bacterial Ig-like domain (group 2)
MSACNCRCHKYVQSSFLCFCLSLLLAAAGCGGASSLSSSNPTKILTAIAASPAAASLAAGATQQFTAKATYDDGSTADVTSAATWTDANAKVATITSSGMATAVAAGSTTIKASLPSGASGTASITVTLSAGTGANITTWHVDNNRSGLNARETSLTPTNVAPQTFGKLFSYLVDGYAYAEPLLMSNVTINGAVHDVLYVATENDSVYAFDADNYGTGAPLWKTSLLNSGEAPISGPIQPYEGVTSTPVIDPATSTIYVVSVQKAATGAAGFRLNALDITTGARKFGSPVAVQASVKGTNSDAVNGTISLPTSCIQRAALLLANGTIYMGFSSCHSGWLLSYDAHTLSQTGVFNASPNIDGEGTYGGAGGVWMGSGGPVADSAGNIYISTGNGPWNPSQGSYGDSILKFSPSLTLLDYFTPEEYGYMNCEDSDLAAGGLMMIPGSGQIVGGGKMGKIYLLNTASLGHESVKDTGAVQRLFVEQGIESSQPYPTFCTDSDASGNPLPNGKTWNVGGPNDSNGDTSDGINSYEIFGTSAYLNGSMYLGVTPTSTSAPGVVRQFTYAAPGVLSATQEFTPLGVAQ